MCLVLYIKGGLHVCVRVEERDELPSALAVRLRN